ncbi:MAG TPA: glycosyltransferase [Terrimicrobiaceae bacterium]
MAVKSLLILTASFGEGHNAAARNLREAITLKSPQTNVLVSDIFLDAYGWLIRLVEKGYLTVINHLPHFWRTTFELLDRTRIIEQHIGIYGAAARRLARLIAEHQPSVIASTYPGCNHLLDFIYRKRLKRPFRTATIITDSLTINSVWYRAQSDFFLVANEPTAEVLVKAGISNQKVRVLGFPVPRIFARLEGLRPVPPQDGRWRLLYVINSGRHMAPEIARRLMILDDVQLAVTTGRDEDLARQISAISAATGRKADVFGWIPDMPRLMAESHLLISKAGGATVQESLAAKTPMIITQVVPGQEEGNARLIIEKGAGALATTPLEISAAARGAFANGARRWIDWQQAASSLSHPSAADDIAEFLLGLA